MSAPSLERVRAEKLWKLIDDIDTADDACRGDDKAFREYARKRMPERHAVLATDGYALFLPKPEADGRAPTIEEVARDVLQCAIAHAPDACLIGNVRARDIARLAATALITCPKCGAEAWCDIDCDLCRAMSAIDDETAEGSP